MLNVVCFYAGIDAFYAYVEVITLDAKDTDTTSLISDVRTVGNAIDKLLFHLPEPCGLNDLVTACDDFCREEYFHQKLLVTTCTCIIFYNNYYI